jgi:hypothetical protein
MVLHFFWMLDDEFVEFSIAFAGSDAVLAGAYVGACGEFAAGVSVVRSSAGGRRRGFGS